MCHLVIPASVSVHESALDCSLCHRELFKGAIDNALDTLLHLNGKLIAEKNKCEVLHTENHSLRDTVARLEAQLEVLRSDNDVLARKLIHEAELRSQVLLESDQITVELNELTERVFEEASLLVSAEARKRAEEEGLRRRILCELEAVKSQQELDQSQLRALRLKFDELSTLQSGSQDALGGGSDAAVTEGADDNMLLMPRDEVRRHIPEGLFFDPGQFCEFQQFLRDLHTPTKINSLPFMRRCIEEDFEPCLKGLGWMTLRRALDAFAENTCFVECPAPSSPSSLEPEPACALCHQRRVCQYRYRLRDSETWRPLDSFCRDRLVAVGNFYSFLRTWRSGLNREASEQELFVTACHLRARVLLSRSGLSRTASAAATTTTTTTTTTATTVRCSDEARGEPSPMLESPPFPSEGPFASLFSKGKLFWRHSSTNMELSMEMAR